jgi:hypothetical protein
MSAQLAQALAAIHTLTQQNRDLEQQNQVLATQFNDMHAQMQRQQQVQHTQAYMPAGQEQATGNLIESSPPKRQKTGSHGG